MKITAPTSALAIAVSTLLLALAYYLTAWLSLLLAIPPGFSTAIWPASGLALAAVLLAGNRVTGGVFLGSLAANITVGQSDVPLSDIQWLVPVLIAVGSTVQAALSRLLILHICRPNWEFLSTRETLALILVGGPLGCIISATNGNITLLANGLIEQEVFLYSWFNWWIGDSLGVFVVTPVALMWAQSSERIDSRRKMTVTVPLLALLACVTLLYASSRDNIQNQLKEHLTKEADAALIGLRSLALVHNEALKGLKAFFLSSEFVSETEFSSYASAVGEPLPAIQALEWAPRVKGDQLPEFRATFIDNRRGNITLREIGTDGLKALSDRPAYQPVTYLWPDDGSNRSALGLDLLSHPDRANSIQQALESGKVTASGPLDLVQGRQGYLLISPIDPPTLQDVVVAVITLDKYFADLNELLGGRNIDVSVTDVSRNTLLFAFVDGASQTTPQALEPVETTDVIYPLTFGQNEWQLRARLNHHYVAAVMQARLWPVLTAGFAIIGCLSLLIISTTGAQMSSMRQVEESTRELDSERRFLETLIENLPIILYVKDATTRNYLRFNKAASNFFRLSSDPILGQSREQAFSENMPEPEHNTDDDVVNKGEIVREKTSFTFRGKDYRFDTRKIPIRRSDGSVQYILGLAEDITSETDARRELQESQDYLTMVLNSVGEGIYGIDTAGKCTFVNRAGCTALGYEEGELLGKNLHNLLHHKYKDGTPYPEQNCPILSSLVDGKSHRIAHEVFWHKNGSSIPVEYLSSPIVEHDRVTGAVIVFSDISKRQAVERLQKEHTQRLEQINTELEEFSFVASHDIQEPLRTLNCFCEFLVEDIGQELPEKARVDIEYITQASQRMNMLINDMLEFSRAGRTSLEMSKVPLQRCVENIKKDLMLLIRDKQAVIELGDNLPLVLGDEAQLTRIFQNLLHNAMKFSDKERRPRVKIEQLPDHDPDFVWITVTDNGIGIERRFHDHIFGAFRRLHQNEQYSGSGIGLAVVKKLVERHGGTIRVESELGVGTTFYIRLKKYPTESVMEEIGPELYNSSHSSPS